MLVTATWIFFIIILSLTSSFCLPSNIPPTSRIHSFTIFASENRFFLCFTKTQAIFDEHSFTRSLGVREQNSTLVHNELRVRVVFFFFFNVLKTSEGRLF